MMALTFRVVLAITLVFAFFLVKNHLDSIDDQLKSHSGRSAGRDPDFTWKNAGAHIELVSGDYRTSSSPVQSSATPSLASTSTGKSYQEPTGKPVNVPRFEPQQIPVEVPGGGEDDLWMDDLWLDDYLDQLDDEVGNSEPKPPPLKCPS